MLRKLLKVFLWIVFILSLFIAVAFVVMAVKSSLLNSKCKTFKTVLNIKAEQEGIYETVIPEFLASDAVVYVNTAGMNSGEIERIKTRGFEGEWLIKDKNGKEIVKDNLLFNKGGWVRDGNSYPARYFCVRRNAEAPGKFIVRIKKTDDQASVPADFQLVFRPYFEYGEMATMFCVILGGIALFITLVTGLTLYKVIIFYRAEKQKE